MTVAQELQPGCAALGADGTLSFSFRPGHVFTRFLMGGVGTPMAGNHFVIICWGFGFLSLCLSM